MKMTKTTLLFLVLTIILLGSQLIEQADALAIRLGLPGFSRITVSDQYVIS